MRILLLSILLIISQLVLANEPTIYTGSVRWDDLAARTSMLESAKIPTWDQSALNAVYEVYEHPQRYQLLSSTSEQKNNTLFLDAYWGPVGNPFVKYARPAKIFVYVGLESKPVSFMVPIIKNASDGNYYVFHHTSSKPQLLIDWINELKSAQSQPDALKFNICNGYGNLPTDTCAGQSYQNEESYALSASSNGSDVMKLSTPDASISAYREPGEDWRHHYMNKPAMFGASATASGSIVNASIDWNNVAKRHKLLQTTTAWPNYKTIKENFEKMRDIRYFNDKQKDGFLRRISWLYPDDGCWTRASAVINHLFGENNNIVNQFARPSKIFAFGNLCAKTANAKSGKVTWWYHTAPMVRDAQTNQTYVLDPSIDPLKPMTTEDWVAAISANNGPCKNEDDSEHNNVETFNVCTGYGAGPGDVCTKEGAANFANEARHALSQTQFHVFERNRQVQLGRDADKVLGDEAPWL
jgi:hypothetical protein